MTDTYPFIDTEASHTEWKEVYYIWVLRKQPNFSDKHSKFAFRGKPKGISLLGEREELWEEDGWFAYFWLKSFYFLFFK